VPKYLGDKFDCIIRKFYGIVYPLPYF